jgi:outer membrane cobalamin receptor
VGARAEYNDRLNKTGFDPRMSLAYKTGDAGQFSFAYGMFRQSPKNDWLRINQKLQSEKAEHFILNYQRIENNKTLRVETYYKRYTNLVKFGEGGIADLNNRGNGYARGFELFWRDNETFKSVDYWVSYSFLDTKRNYLNFPQSATPSFASRHNFSMVYKHFVKQLKSQLGFTYSYASGRPYQDPNNNIFNGKLTPHYEDLSFNWSYLPKPYLIIYFSCTNLLAHNNIFSYEFSSQKNEEGLYNGRAITQPAPRFVFLGIFITLSKDKSVNQLPTL